MTRQEFEYQLLVVADIQRREGWSERSVGLYAEEMRDLTPDECLGLHTYDWCRSSTR